MAEEAEEKRFPKRCSNIPSPLLLLLLMLSFSLRSEAQSLPRKEMYALRRIKSKLNITKWDFKKNPCKGASGWVGPPNSNSYEVNNLTCGDCNALNVCHVVSVQLNGQNLSGVLPDEFANLTHLFNLSLVRNYLNGTIPKTWASLPLLNLSLSDNRISGSIPDEIGNFATLQSLELEANQLQGPIPATLGKLRSLRRFLATANNFSGVLPESLGNLTNIIDFRIDGNPISGTIPSFIGNWTQITRLDMQGIALQGPFPPIFSTLQSLMYLRVSDWKGGDGKFPSLQNMRNLKELVLRNLSISSKLPDFLGNMPNLKVLDLSFNNLTGPIPNTLDPLRKSITNMYLTNNKLTGDIPEWISSSSRANLDLSYNTFTGMPYPNCQQDNVNFVASYSSTDSNSIRTCLKRGLPCSGKAKNYNLFINCGGGKVQIGDDEYEKDTTPVGASTYALSESQKWAYSSTGNFISNRYAKYIATNASELNMPNPELYMNARLSPLSLRYYGLCLQNGNYTVNLYFAEIMFTDDHTYSSLGKRLFDVSIQGDKVLQDFNIAKEANGTARAIIKTFATTVNANTLEIHFQWTGKGTHAIPHKGVYGPLISAISVTPNFNPNKLSVGAIVGIVIGSCAVILLIVMVLWICVRRKSLKNNELKGLELQTGYFTLKQIKSATRNFNLANKIGEGGFGPVYKGVLPDGSIIAVKQLSSKSKQGNREFINEIGMISALQHPNLVKLFGCCVEGNQLLVIYEYMENNSLARALFGPERSRLKLDWQARHRICLDIARGLAYLHEESRLKIVHRDIKATNILLDKDLNAKISDFGLAKLNEEENTHISTRIAGTVGYMAPEYAMRGYLTGKADVYSFGVVMLEIVSGMSNTNYKPKEDCMYLLDWAYVLQEQGNIIELVDPNLGSNYSKEQAHQMLNLVLICTNPSPTLRPTMSTVVSMLDGNIPVRVPSVKSAPVETEGARFKSLEKLSHDSQTHSISAEGPPIDSSVSSESSKDKSRPNSITSKPLPDYIE